MQISVSMKTIPFKKLSFSCFLVAVGVRGFVFLCKFGCAKLLLLNTKKRSSFARSRKKIDIIIE